MNERTLHKWFALCDKAENLGYQNLTPAEQVWMDIRSLIDSTNNGGIISYFYNSGADRLNECLAALDLLDATTVRAQLERIIALFPDGVPDTVIGRNEVIDSWDDNDESINSLLEEVDNVMFSQIEQLEEKLNQFLIEQGLLED